MDDRAPILVPLELNPHELRCAARLGGLQLTLDDELPDWGIPLPELIALYVVPGLHHALQDSFDRAYPLHYPDDVELKLCNAEAEFTYQWLPIWRGKAKW